MNSDRQRQITGIFHSAIAREGTERRAFLEGACGGDDALRGEVESLISSHESAGTFIASPAYERGAELLAGELAGRSFGQYRLVSLLGVGGMGEVYLGDDTRLDRRVALKVLPAHLTSDHSQLGRFQQEARAASALNHPNIVTIYEINEAAGTHYIATEYIEGVTLRTRLGRGGLTLGEAVEIAVEIAAALNAAHSAGVVHRDIKPENVMLRPDGYVKVLDFGIAKLIERQRPAPDAEAATRALVQTGKGVVMGTAHYMSPEQARGIPVDARTDIWSLAVVLYELVTGQVPFAGDTASDCIASILKNEPAALTTLAPLAPLRLEWILQKALRKDRDERYHTAKELLSDLREVRREVEATAQAERSFSSTPAQSGLSATMVQPASTEPPTETASESTPRAAATHTTSSAEYIVTGLKRHKLGVLLALTVLVVIIAGTSFAIYKYARHPKSAHFEKVKLTRITTEGNLKSVGVSPDGKYISYSISENGKYSLWTKHLGTGSRVQIVPPVEAGGMAPHFFSPDGGYVYYYVFNDQYPRGALFQVAVLGGESKKILSNVQSTVTLSPDGKQIAFGRYHAGSSEQFEFWLASVDGSNERKLRAFSEPEFSNGYGAAWSPDGKEVAIDFGSVTGGEHMTVLLISVADGSVKALTNQRWNQVGRGAWFADGSGMAVVASETPISEYQIWRVTRDGAAQPITNDLSSYGYFSLTLTADSRTLVALQEESSANIWVAGSDASNAHAITNQRKSVEELNAEWTPDGRLIYKSHLGGGFRIWIMNADGSNQKPLTEPGEDADNPLVSPDGKYIFYTSVRSKIRRVWRMDLDGSNARQLTESTGVGSFSLTPDGSAIVYDLVASGIWKVSTEGGAATKLLDKVVFGEEISPDGKFLAYTTDDDRRRQIVIMNWPDLSPFKIFDWPAAASDFVWRWSPDSRALVYKHTKGGVSNLWRLPLDGSPRSQISDFKTDTIRYFSYSRDGRQLAFVRSNITRDAVLITDEK